MTLIGHSAPVRLRLLGSHCRLRDELAFSSNQILFFSEQLLLLTNVKRMTHEFDLTVNMLLKTAENLMKSVLRTLNVVEAILLKVCVSSHFNTNVISYFSDTVSLGGKKVKCVYGYIHVSYPDLNKA